MRRVASSTVFPSSHERCRSIDIAQLRPFCGPSMAVPFPRKTLRYSKSGNSLFMAGSENLERYWKRPGRESKRRRERRERRDKEAKGEDGLPGEREGPNDEGRGAILVGRKCPLGKTGGASSRPRSDKAKKETPLRHRRHSPYGHVTHVTASPPIKFK